MSTFLNIRTTVKGGELLAAVHDGSEQLVIKAIAFGGGTWTAEQIAAMDLTALVDQKLVVPVSGIEQTGGQAVVNCVLVNDDLTEGFPLTEIGVIAQTTGGDILYMADTIPASKSTWICPASEFRVSIPVPVRIACSSDYEVQIVVNSEAPVTTAELGAHDTAPGAHADIRALIAGKAPTGHGHGISNISGLQSALNGKSGTGHGHGIGGVSGLQSALNGKSGTGHGHGIGDVSGLQSALNDKSGVGHGHPLSQITGLKLSHKCLVHSTGTGALNEVVDSNLPANIVKNATYVLSNPWGNVPVIAIAEVKYDNKWGETGWIYSHGALAAYGTTASGIGNKIVVQTGSGAVFLGKSARDGSPFGLGSSGISQTQFPCRIHVFRVGA